MYKTKKQLQKCLSIIDLIERMERRMASAKKYYNTSVFADIRSNHAHHELDIKQRSLDRLNQSLIKNLKLLC